MRKAAKLKLLVTKPEFKLLQFLLDINLNIIVYMIIHKYR
jgi:hypothetical protein